MIAAAITRMKMPSPSIPPRETDMNALEAVTHGRTAPTAIIAPKLLTE